jgi:hypothetical protein
MPFSTSRGSATPFRGSREAPCLTPLDARAKEVVDSVGVKVRDEDRARSGRRADWGVTEDRGDLRGAGDNERLLNGGGVPKGVE